VACGFHAGDPSIMRRTCATAVELGVRIGAHVGYRDLAGFGRRRLDVEPPLLHDETLYQLGGLDACARAEGGAVSYVKPHGALYHRCSTDADAADAVVGALRAFGAGLAVVGAPGSALLRRADAAGLDAIPEGFADRAYSPDGALVARSEHGAVLDPDAAVAQAVAIASTGSATAAGGTAVAVAVRTLCVHGDTAGAVALARRVREALEQAGVAVAPFA
jgi:5-oxoprolinase (ATP-hydrolysing) subunit A